MSSKRRLSNGSGVLGLDLVDDEDDVPIAPPRRRSIIPAQSSRDAEKDQGRIAEMYKTIIKMSSENVCSICFQLYYAFISMQKINAKNSWNLDLIDHMDKIISDEANENGNDVNFQKASCTLDASIKIYSHRVDDTWSSSYRILENLSRNEHHDEPEEEGADDVKKPARVGAKTISNKHGLVDTIERNIASINSTQVGKENVADPMFHKMSQAFDEGGAKGMLMNNLRVVPNTSTITFSSMDTASVAATSADDELVPLDELLTHLPQSDVTAASICPHLQQYRDTLYFPSYDPSLLGFNIFDTALQPLALPEEELVTKFEYLTVEDDFNNDDEDDNEAFDAAPLNEEVHDQKVIQWDTVFDTAAETVATPRSSLSDAASHAQATVNMKLLSCLETTNLWAGAKHWKSSLRQRSAKEKAAEEKEAAPAKSRKKKEKFMFDFYNAVSKIEATEKSSKRDTTQQTEAALAKNKANADDLLLPVDEKLTKKDLCRLFLLEDKKYIQPKNCKMAFETISEPLPVSSPVEPFTNDVDDLDDGCDMDDFCDTSMPTPQEPPSTGFTINTGDLLQASRTVEKIQIGYATTSKRVNVRKLKTDIWDELECVKEFPVKTLETVTPQAQVSFQDMISTVANKQTQKDVSVSFYFICLLHLANEKVISHLICIVMCVICALEFVNQR